MEILLIEDDMRIADFLQRGLRAEGYSVQHIRNGRDGLGAAQNFARACQATASAGVIILA